MVLSTRRRSFWMEPSMTRIMLSKPKLMLLILVSFSVFSPVANALSYSSSLPSNTIYFNDFTQDTVGSAPSQSVWFSLDTCPKASPNFPNVSVNGTEYYDSGKSLMVVAAAAGCNAQDARHSFNHPSNILGFAGWLGFSCNMAKTSGVQDFGVSLEYISQFTNPS